MDYTILVNKYNKISKEEMNNIEKVSVKDIFNEDILIEKETLFYFNKLKEFLNKKGIEIGIDSAYRSIEDQEEIIKKYREERGEEYVKKYVAPINTSEHHTGLAIDFLIKSEGKFLTEIEDIWNNLDIYLEIHKYISNFGFILRYPKGREKTTGYSYEPWHIRYVGKKTATYIMNSHITLEEYYFKKHSGILLINKEKDMTSRDVVNIISKKLHLKKVGHTGTLDPLATGLLVITIGNATKIGELLTSLDKEYEAEFVLGVLTDTLDITGKVLKEKKTSSKIDIESALKHFTTTYNQEVPIYSAVKVHGKKLYQYARENKTIKLPKKEVTIKKLELLDYHKGLYKIKCLVSKGTYIRSLIRDIGEYLNTYATMTNLKRTSQSNFLLKDSFTINDIKTSNFKIIPIKDCLNIKKISIKDDLLFKVRNGVVLTDLDYDDEQILFLDEEGFEVALYRKEDNKYKPWKVFI